MKWPHVAAHTRAGIAGALATITPALIADAARLPPASVLRTALYGWAFNLGRSGSQPPVEIAQVLAWARRHSLPLTGLAEPVVARPALHAITLRLDGGRAAAATITASAPSSATRSATQPNSACCPRTRSARSPGGRRTTARRGWPREQMTSPTSAALSSSASCVLSKLATTCCER